MSVSVLEPDPGLRADLSALFSITARKSFRFDSHRPQTLCFQLKGYTPRLVVVSDMGTDFPRTSPRKSLIPIYRDTFFSPSVRRRTASRARDAAG